MSPFDQTTQAKAEEWYDEPGNIQGFVSGRNSAKESLEILARAVEKVGEMCRSADHYRDDILFVYQDAIADVKARGDWPLEDECES